MQSSIEGFFSTRHRPSVVVRPGPGNEDIAAIHHQPIVIDNEEGNGEIITAEESRNHLMSLLSGPQTNGSVEIAKKKRGRPRKDVIEEKEIGGHALIETMPVTLRVSSEKLKGLQKARVNPRDLFAVTTKVKRKMIVKLHVDPVHLQNIALGNTISLLSDDSGSQTDILTDSLTEDDSDLFPKVNIKDILGAPRLLKRKPSDGEIQIIDESKPLPIFKSKISATSVLQNFKERQQQKNERLNEREEELTGNGSHSFFKEAADRAIVAKLMKEKGISKPIPAPTLRESDFHIYDSDDFQARKLSLPLKGNNASESIVIHDHRFGETSLSQQKEVPVYRYTYEDTSMQTISELITQKISSFNGNSRLIELLALFENDAFQEKKRLNNLMFCNLFKPRNHHSLLIPSKKTKQLMTWFQNCFTNLPKKKPNRSHLFKKNQEEVLSDMDSFIINDVFEEDADVEKDQELPILVVTGECGIGKTAAIETILGDLNSYIYNVDPSTIDKKEVREMAVHQKYDNHMKQDSCILFDEIPDDEETFFGILKSVLIVTRKPIVLIVAKDEIYRLPHWLDQAERVDFKRTNESLLVTYLSIMGLMVGVEVADDVLLQLVSASDGDLRRSITELQALTSGLGKKENKLVKLSYNRKEASPAEQPRNLDDLLRDYERRSAAVEPFGMNEYLAKEDKVKQKNKYEIFSNSTRYCDSKNSYKFSKRALSMPKHFEFQSSIYNLTSRSNWLLFRLEFFEFLKQVARTDELRDPHYRIYRDDPPDILRANNIDPSL